MKKSITITIVLLVSIAFSIPAFAGGNQYNYEKHSYDNYQRSLTTPGMNTSTYKQIYEIRKQQ